MVQEVSIGTKEKEMYSTVELGLADPVAEESRMTLLFGTLITASMVLW